MKEHDIRIRSQQLELVTGHSEWLEISKSILLRAVMI